MKGVAHKLPLLPNATKLSVAEMSWLVNVALQLSKSCAVVLPSPKRNAEAADLEGIVKALPVNTQELNLNICGPAKAAKLLRLGPENREDWLAT